MTTLADIFSNKGSKYCDKWEQYLAVYERELGRFLKRGEPVTLLEIGTQNGGSLELWSQYLPRGTAIIGLDINPTVTSLVFDNPFIRTYAMDATRPEGIELSLGNQEFDIIIDDGSHKSSDIISSFELFYNRLRPGGLYIIEDLHCSYISEYEGGYRRENSSIEWLKDLADAVNCDHINASEIEMETLFAHKSLATSLASVTFYDSICVIEKLNVEKARPYRRLISGERGEIEPVVETLIDTQPRYVFDTVLFGRSALRQANARLLATQDTQLAAVRTLQERLAWVQREAHERIEALTQQVARGAEALVTQLEAVRTLDERLAWVKRETGERIEALTNEAERGAEALATRIEEVRTLDERLAWVRREAGERIEALTNEVERGAQAQATRIEEVRMLKERLLWIEGQTSARIDGLIDEVQQGAQALSAVSAEHRERQSHLEVLRQESDRLRTEKEELRLALTRACAWHT